MKRIIRKIIPAIIILFLGASIIGNWFLLNQNFHLNKKIEELNKEAEKYQAIEEDYKSYFELYNNCEFNLSETMKTLEAQTKELEALKKN